MIGLKVSLLAIGKQHEAGRPITVTTLLRICRYILDSRRAVD